MPQDYGPAQPIVDTIQNGIQKVEHFFGGISTPTVSHPDTSWHDSMVKAANDSFKQQSAGAGMAKFEQSHEHHQVHELHRPQGHGYIDQKYGKGNRSVIGGSVPQVESGAMPSMDGAGSPGTPGAEYGSGPSGV